MFKLVGNLREISSVYICLEDSVCSQPIKIKFALINKQANLVAIIRGHCTNCEASYHRVLQFSLPVAIKS